MKSSLALAILFYLCTITFVAASGEERDVHSREEGEERLNRFEGNTDTNAPRDRRRTPVINGYGGHPTGSFLQLAGESPNESPSRPDYVAENIESGTSEELNHRARALPLSAERRRESQSERGNRRVSPPSASDHDGDLESNDEEMMQRDILQAATARHLANTLGLENTNIPRESTDTVRNIPDVRDNLSSTWSTSNPSASLTHQTQAPIVGTLAAVTPEEREHIDARLTNNRRSLVRQSSSSGSRARLSNIGNLPYRASPVEPTAEHVHQNSPVEPTGEDEIVNNSDYYNFVEKEKRRSSGGASRHRRGSSPRKSGFASFHPYANALNLKYDSDASPSISRMPSRPSQAASSRDAARENPRGDDLGIEEKPVSNLRQDIEKALPNNENKYTEELKKIKKVYFGRPPSEETSLTDSRSSVSNGKFITMLFYEAGIVDLALPRILARFGNEASKLVFDVWHKYSMVAARYNKRVEWQELRHKRHPSQHREVSEQTQRRLRMDLKKLYYNELQAFLDAFPQYRQKYRDEAYLFPPEMVFGSPFENDIIVYESFMKNIIRLLVEEFINVTPRGRKLLQYWLTQNLTSPLAVATYAPIKAALGATLFIIFEALRNTVWRFPRGYIFLADFLSLFVMLAGLYAYFTNYCLLHGMFSVKTMQNGYWSDYNQNFYEQEPDEKKKYGKKMFATGRQLAEYARFVFTSGDFVPKFIFDDDGQSVHSISTDESPNAHGYNKEMRHRDTDVASTSAPSSSDISIDQMRRNRRLLEPIRLLSAFLTVAFPAIVICLIIFFGSPH